MNGDTNILDARRTDLIGSQRLFEQGGCSLLERRNVTIAHSHMNALSVSLRVAAKFGRNVVILGLMAVCNCLAPSAQAVDLTASNAQSNALSSVPTPAGQSNSIVRLPEGATTSGKPNGSTNTSVEGSNVSKTGSTNSMDALDDRHKLNIGDRLSFRIVEDEDDPRQISVTDSGDLELPYVGRYPAVGQTCKELALKLKTELEKEYYYHATVIIAVNEWAKSQGKVYIVGPVRAPGPQEIPSDEVFTLSKAILRAGGFGDYADRRKVEVRRKSAASGGKDLVYTVDVVEILEKGKSDADVSLQAGDVIFIPERLVRF
jgi:polysaccharide biosynthesis/export protein